LEKRFNNKILHNKTESSSNNVLDISLLHFFQTTISTQFENWKANRYKFCKSTVIQSIIIAHVKQGQHLTGFKRKVISFRAEMLQGGEFG